MTQTSSTAAIVPTGDFRVSAVVSRSASLLWRRLPSFFLVGLVVSLPILLLAIKERADPAAEEAPSDLFWLMFVLVSLMVFSTIGQAVIVHAAFQDMRRKPVRLVESLNAAVQRFWPLIGLALAGLLTMMGLMGLIFSTLWFVSLPACIVEQLGPWTSLYRSRELTRRYRWKAFGLALLLLIPSFGSSVLERWVTAATSPVVGVVGELMWTGIWTAFTAIITIVTYHDLRVVKEGTDIEQVAVVFD
jgi:hypothetical protein